MSTNSQIHEVYFIKKNFVAYLLITCLIMTGTGFFTAELFSQQISTLSGQIFVRTVANQIQDQQILPDEPVPLMNADLSPDSESFERIEEGAELVTPDNLAGLADEGFSYDEYDFDESSFDESSIESPVSADDELDLSDFDVSELEDLNDTISRGSTVVPEIPKTTATTVHVVKKPIELAPWFGKVNQIYAKDDIATVTDVETGMTMQIKRTGGSNHADVETMTASDTATLMRISGGSWSWTRRPVIVEVDGHRYAASMAAMPHAGRDDQPARVSVRNRSGGYGRGTNWDSVKGNDMDGHFDIHFHGSKTHGSHRVDPDHQAAIREAFQSKK